MDTMIWPTTPVDATLTQEGEAADAKVTGDALDGCLCYPDYTSLDKLGSTGTFTIGSNGYLQLKASTGSTDTSIFHRIIVNGWTVDEGHTASRNYSYYSSPLIPVMAGDVVEVVGGISGVTYNTYLYRIRK